MNKMLVVGIIASFSGLAAILLHLCTYCYISEWWRDFFGLFGPAIMLAFLPTIIFQLSADRLRRKKIDWLPGEYERTRFFALTINGEKENEGAHLSEPCNRVKIWQKSTYSPNTFTAEIVCGPDSGTNPRRVEAKLSFEENTHMRGSGAFYEDRENQWEAGIYEIYRAS
jgi:hypothetical protein